MKDSHPSAQPAQNKRTIGFVHRVAFVLAVVVMSNAFSQEASIRVNVSKHLPDMAPIDSVLPSPIPGLYEIDVAGHVMYTDSNGSYIFDGSIVDIRNGKRNLTRERWGTLNKVDFRSLPLQYAVVRKMGNGQGRMALFEDANCVYCKALERKIHSEVRNATIYTFLLSKLSPDSKTKAKAVWCSAHPGEAWESWMVHGIAPNEAPSSCDGQAIEKASLLADQLHIVGTPTIIFASGRRVQGIAATETLKAELNDSRSSAPPDSARGK
jgi:thiol:disulfide interchange protein DsbC